MSSTKTYFRRLAEGYENGFFAKMLLPLLAIAGFFYSAGAGFNRFLYEKGILKAKRLPFPVISVGNLTWGGTGKTPLVEYLARRVSDRNQTGLVLTRGYGKDESEQLKHHLSKSVVGIGRDRYKIAMEIAAKQKIHAAILDDGLQHGPIARDLEIVTINALNPFGNGKTIPMGILREGPSVLRKVEIITISHANLVTPAELSKLREEIRKYAPQAMVLDTYLEPLFFYRAKKRMRVPLNKLQNQKVTTFSGVGAPRSFQLVLSRLQAKPVRNFEFTDHHVFTEKELHEIKKVSDSAFSVEIVTTEKDYYRCPKTIAEILNPLILATRLRFSSGEHLLNEKLAALLERK